MKERKTIYCKEAEVWDRVVECAKEGDISISQLLLSPFQKSGSVQVGLGQINRMESKLDEIIGEHLKYQAKDLIEDVIIPPKTWRDTDYEKHEQNAIDHPPHALGDSPVESTDYVDRTTRGDMAVPRSDDEVIREAQDKLENIQASRGYFNPQPKKGK